MTAARLTFRPAFIGTSAYYVFQGKRGRFLGVVWKYGRGRWYSTQWRKELVSKDHPTRRAAAAALLRR